MTDDIFTAEAQIEIEPGTYEVTLTEISEPRTIFPQTGPNSGKEVVLRDWTFNLEDGTPIVASASLAIGRRSKQLAWITALLGGTPPPEGQTLKRSDLYGRVAYAAIETDADGWLRITAMTALPKARAAAPVAAPVATPDAAPPARRPAPISPVVPGVGAASGDDLPF